MCKKPPKLPLFSRGLKNLVNTPMCKACMSPPPPLEEPLDEELDPRSKLREYVDSKRRAVAKRLCYARPTRCSWPLKQGSMGDIS